ncbi:MAG: hypothetical protein L3J56_14700, partial [Bacteroidales bacterium]|nr:hypothetical protein [Bacteroidales bacterium]
MQKYFSEFTVEIIDNQFSKDNINYPKTAVIKFFNNNKLLSEEEFGYADSNYISKYIKENNELQLNYAYIENIDLEFLKAKVYSEKIILENFSAKNAFFHSPEKDINFSEILFEGKLIDFNSTYFICKTLNFSFSIFFAELNDFSNCFFKCDTVNFSKTSFSDGDVIFKNSVFSEGIKDFENIEFQEGKVIFV